MVTVSLPWSHGSLLVTLPGAGLSPALRGLALGVGVVVPLVLLIVLYRYELRLVRRSMAALLLGLRLGVFALVVALVCLQPIYARERTIEEPGRVVVLVDRSASMEVRDPQRDQADKLRLARRFVGLSATDEAWIARWLADHAAERPPAWLLAEETKEEPARRRQLEAERRQLHARLIAAVDEMTRTETARRILAGEKGLLARLGARHTVALFGFDRGVHEARPDDLDGLFAKASTGSDGTDIRLALERAGAGEKSLAVVVLTDGQHNQGSGPLAEAASLGKQQVPVYAVALGDRRSPPALAVVSLRGPGQTVFQGVDVVVEVEARLAGQKAGDYVLELARDGGERKVLDTRAITHDGKDRLFRDRFTITLDETGTRTLTATIRPAQPEEGWKPAAKDIRTTTVSVADDRAGVLLVDGEARWEYHYLEKALKRDPLVRLDRIVFEQPRLNGRLSASQETALDLPGRAWPEGENGLAKYSLVLLGDIDPARLPLARRQALEKFVADGGTLVVVAGKRFMPLAYPEGGAEMDPLRRLLPIERPRVLAPETGFGLGLTRAGRDTRFMELEADSEENALLWAGHPRPWGWAVAGRAKPGATALAGWLDPGDRPMSLDERERRNAVVARHNFGFGRVLFVGLDGTWRWRFKVGDLYHHRFWGQVVRWAADRPLLAGNRAVRFGSSLAVYRPGDPVEVMARLSDPATRPGLLAGARVVRLPDGNGAEKSEGLVSLERSASRSSALEGRLRNLQPGRYAIELTIPDLGGLQRSDPDRAGKTVPLRAGFSVVTPESREGIDLECNEALLRQIAAASGGRVFRPEEVDELEALVSARSVTRAEHHAQPLWQWWPVLVMLAGLLSVEWVVRKWSGLP